MLGVELRLGGGGLEVERRETEKGEKSRIRGAIEIWVL
jgi:hypothetical protein